MTVKSSQLHSKHIMSRGGCYGGCYESWGGVMSHGGCFIYGCHVDRDIWEVTTGKVSLMGMAAKLPCHHTNRDPPPAKVWIAN